MPSGPSSIRALEIDPGQEMFDSVFVGEGGMFYLAYQVDDLVDKLVFDLSRLRKTAENENGIQMVYKIGDNWRYEDVSPREEVSFCRGRPAERGRPHNLRLQQRQPGHHRCRFDDERHSRHRHHGLLRADLARPGRVHLGRERHRRSTPPGVRVDGGDAHVQRYADGGRDPALRLAV